jgi:hypothetical protein
MTSTIDTSTLYSLITDLIKSESNILLYGYGSKLKLIYEYLKHFQEKINGKDSDYHILIFNCYNSELNIKFILGEIFNFLNDIKKKLIAQNSEEKSNNYQGEYEGSCKTVDEQLKKINALSNFLFEKEILSRILIVVNNIDAPSFCNYFSQKVFSQLFLDNSKRIHLLATCDNLYLNYFWNQTIKDNYSFYFLRFNTFENYDMEISDKNSLTGEKNIKAGMGLVQILKSLTQNQRDMIKLIANEQLAGNGNQLSLKNLTNLLINEMIASTQNQVLEYLIEPKDHHLIVERKISTGTVYKLNLSEEILQKFISGEYDKLD